jgi:hypothetical protein
MLKKLPISVARSKKIAVLELTPRLSLGIAHRSQDEHDGEKADQDSKEAGALAAGSAFDLSAPVPFIPFELQCHGQCRKRFLSEGAYFRANQT